MKPFKNRIVTVVQLKVNTKDHQVVALHYNIVEKKNCINGMTESNTLSNSESQEAHNGVEESHWPRSYALNRL